MDFFSADQFKDLLSMMLVGALWGCTNPLLRKGSVETNQNSTAQTTREEKSSFLKSTLKIFLSTKVWLPYVLNQCGSVVFYILLSNSDLSLAVPICNAMALLFSFGTSAALGEPISNPFRTFLGAALVMLGVAICISTQESAEEEEQEL